MSNQLYEDGRQYGNVDDGPGEEDGPWADGWDRRVPDGWTMVPVHATTEMMDNGAEYINAGLPACDVWRVMVAAAPSSQHEQGEK